MLMFWFFVLYLCSDQSEIMAPFCDSNLWSVPDFSLLFFFFWVLWLLLFVSGSFPVTTCGLDLFSGVYLNK